MEINRRRARVIVDINVTLTTVLDSIDARIIDLSEHGAQVVGAALPEGSKFQIEYMGQTVFAQCRWAEIDRMGIKFLFPLNEGPLYERLLIARASQMSGDPSTGTNVAMAPIHNGRVTLGARTFSRVATGGFGRRN